MSLNNSDDDLTTDAVPTPPRDEKKQRSENEPDNNSPPKTKTKKIFKKPKKPATTAFASVINISNANGIHIGSNYNVYLNKSESHSKSDFIVTDAIKKLFESNASVERKHLIFISPHINEDWRTMARSLDYSDGQISQFYDDFCRNGIKEVIYQLLLDWIQNEADSATVGRLSKTLWKTNQEDVVRRWSQEFSEK